MNIFYTEEIVHMLRTDAELPSSKTTSRDVKEFKDATDQNVREFLKVRIAALIFFYSLYSRYAPLKSGG